MKALLLNPPTGKFIRDDRCQVPVRGVSSELRAPIDLAYMAAVIEGLGWECRISDYPAEDRGWDEYRTDLGTFRPDMVIISTTTPTLPGDLEAAAMAKVVLPDATIVAKGAHVTTNDEEVLTACPGLDVAVRGEYELTVKELAERGTPVGVAGLTYREGGTIRRNEDRARLTDLDELPFPARHLLNNSLYCRPDTGEPQTTIQSSRGCPWNCVYCLVPVVSGNRVASRSPKSVADEMAHCVERYGIRNFYFRADTFTANRRFVLDLCREILDRKLEVEWVCNSRVDTIDAERARAMRRAGCWMVGFGIESGSQEILDRIGKGTTLEDVHRALAVCREAGLRTYLFWVLGLPWETRKSALETIRFACSLDGDFAEFHTAYPFPGTPLLALCREHGLLESGELSGHDPKTPIARSFALSADEIKRLQRRAVRSFYLRPRHILKTLRSVDSSTKLWNYVRKGLHVLMNP